jgi:hypothetical protein
LRNADLTNGAASRFLAGQWNASCRLSQETCLNRHSVFWLFVAAVALILDADHGWRALDAALTLDYGTQVPSWTLSRATAIFGDGRTIAGFGTNPQGQTEAWVVILPE